MKVILASGWYFPQHAGGTEVYVDTLARELISLGVEPVVMAPTDAGEVARYSHRGVEVIRYPVAPPRNAAEARGDAPPAGHAVFEQLLQAQHADVYHQHSWSRGTGLHHLASARALGLKTLMTVHTPAPICRRGTLLENGVVPCDGRMQPTRCARCFLRQRGLSATAASALANVPAALSTWARDTAALGKLTSALGASAETAQQMQALRRASTHCDRVIAVCEWLEQMLIANGVDANKLMLCRQGLGLDAAPVATPPPNGRLRIGFLGRFDPVKGIDVLVAALKQLPPERDWACEIRAPSPHDPDGKAYRARVRDMISGDARFSLHEDRPRAELGAFFASIHALAVPSQWFETGPLVVLEAFAHGVPVIGTRLGGIAELVAEGNTGWLSALGDVTALALILDRLAQAPPARLPEAIRLGVRAQSLVAQQMAALYAE